MSKPLTQRDAGQHTEVAGHRLTANCKSMTLWRSAEIVETQVSLRVHSHVMYMHMPMHMHMPMRMFTPHAPRVAHAPRERVIGNIE